MEKRTGLPTGSPRGPGQAGQVPTRHYNEPGRRQAGNDRAQNYQGWEQVLRKIYPPMPRTAPAPLPKTLHRATAPAGAQPPVSASTPASG